MTSKNTLRTKLFRLIKWIAFIFIILCIASYFLNQGFKSKYCGFHRLYKDSIENVMLYKFEPDSFNYCRCGDSLILSKNHISSFVQKWNNSYSIGPIKGIPRFTLTVKMRNGCNRKFNTYGNAIKDYNSFGFKFLCEDDFFESIWNKK